MVVHGVHNNSGMLWNILAHAADMGLEDMVAIQVRHLTVLLDPDLELGVLGQNVERRDVQTELAGLGELANTGSERHEAVPGHTGSILCNVLTHIVNSVLLYPEAVWLVGSVDEVGNVAANVVCQLLKNDFGLFFC